MHDDSLHDQCKDFPADHRIGETIAALLDNFFTINFDIIVYVPMATDGKSDLSLRLFEVLVAQCFFVKKASEVRAVISGLETLMIKIKSIENDAHEKSRLTFVRRHPSACQSVVLR